MMKVNWRRWIDPCVFWICYLLSGLFVGILFPVRCSGLRWVPKRGPLLIVSNHQSFLDPIILGLALGRPAKYIARSTLFWFPPFRWLITALGAIPINQEGVAKEGLKASIDTLARGGTLIIYPEGARTRDGALGSLHPGVLLLLRKVEAPVVISGISGAYESYPIGSRFPIPCPIWVHFEPWNSTLPRGSRESLAELESRMRAVLKESQRRRDQLGRGWFVQWMRNPPPSVDLTQSGNKLPIDG
jgi:1-acyl-sn-glycerol-3-phosphate acyltransferase